MNKQITQAIIDHDAQSLTQILKDSAQLFEEEPRLKYFYRCIDENSETCLIVLIEHFNNPKLNNEALAYAAEEGNLNHINILLPHSDTLYDSSAIINAARNGHKDCVELLIPYSDLTQEQSFVLECAICYGWNDVVDVVHPLSDVKELLEHLQNDGEPALNINHEQFECLVNILKELWAYDERSLIEQQIITTHASKSRNKI